MWLRIYPHVVLIILANTIFKVSCKGNGSLTFLIDETSSMSYDIQQVRESVDKIIRIVKEEKSNLIDNMVLVTFNDPGVYDRVVTRDPEEFKKAVAGINPHNEVKMKSELDCWEPAMKGLLLALNKSKTDSYIFVFTDAPAKDYIDSRYVIEMCQKKQTQIVFMLSGKFCQRKDYPYIVPEARDVYFDIAVACSGLAIFVKKIEVKKVFGAIEEIIKGNKNVITTATVPAGVSTSIPFAIDDHTDYVIVSASGTYVTLKINEPSVSVHEIMSTTNAIVVKLSNIKPGNYVATVKGKTKTFVVIVGRTDFFFSHGFSELKPKSLNDTSPRLQSDAKGYLSVSVTDYNHSVIIEWAKILDMDGNLIIEKLPLTEISKDFYITDLFVAPSQRFKVAIEGIVKATNKPIHRTAKIPVTPSLPKIAPKVQGVTVLKVTKGKTAVLECKVVKGEPKPTITWRFMDNSGPDSPILRSDEMLHISRVENKDAGRYKCVAKNKVGSDEHVTTLEVQDLPKIVSSISNIYETIEGDAFLEIPCIATGLPKPSITWKLNGLVIDSSARYSIENGTLIIRDPKVSDTNSYTCEAKNEVGAVSATFKTNINQAPQVSGVTDKKVRIGKPASIECTVVKGEPKPTITWRFTDSSGPDLPILGSDEVLHISKVKNKHAGRYKCVAKNKVGSDEHVTTLEVQDLPKIVSSISNIYETTEGDAFLEIPCVATGLPKPSITWKLNGLVIDSSAKYSIENGTLIIRDLKVSDTNLYTCEVKNEVGAVSATFKTNINQAPQVSGVTDKKVRIGKPASIECTVVKGEPKPTIAWQFMDSSGPDLSILGSDEVLHISSVENKHAGRYKCVAKNKVGSDEHVTTLEVQDLPKIVSSISNIYESTEGDAFLEIPCVATGLPKPSITWKLNGLVIDSSARYSIENGTLIIRDPKVSDTNSYTCEAKNEVGAVSATFKTNINQAPQVSGVTDKKVRIGKPASIECTVVKGEPKPTIAWQFMDSSGPDSSILRSDEVLHISRVENKDAGRYKCVAKNKVGSDEHVTTLEVQDLPKIVSSISNIYETIEGDAFLEIPCVATGLPKPSITWKLNGLVIDSSARYSIENGTLIIRDPKVSDTNSYTCEAKNEVGAVSATFKTNINQAPQVSGVTDKKVRIGKPASIECTVIKGEPKPTVTWRFMDNFGSVLPIHGSDEVLHISRVENKDAGRYKCVAKNKVGSDEHVTTLIVESLPRITTKLTTVEGIEGDLALRIPCDVVGIPQPVVTWKINGTKITPDGKYSIEDGALVIVKPAKIDSLMYTCEAENNVGSVSTTFQAAVEKHPKTFGTKHNVYLLRGETRKLKCEAYSSESQSVKWFKAEASPRSQDSLSTTTSPPELESSETTTTSSMDYDSSTMLPTITLNATIKKAYIQIVHASYSDDGSYTCRVSDKHGNTHTHTYVVVVGNAPEFLSDVNSLSNWRGVVSEITENCDIQPNAIPKPVVEWRFNGKVLTDFNSASVGHYTCNVSNVYGSVQKRFDVKSSACLITRNLRDAQYMPLVLNDKGFWHKLENTNHYTIVEKKEKITLSCPSHKETSNTFKNFTKKSTLEAFCYKEDSFLVEGKIHKLSDLQCTNSIQPSVIRTKLKCSTETSELIRVGYNVPGFLEAYEVCYDIEKNMPLYTRIIMSETNNNGLSPGYNWFTYPGIGNEKTERGFTCKDTLTSCCYSKSQLVNAKDFNDGPAKRSTFIDPLNVIPVWLPCDTSKPTWETINDNVTALLPNYNEIVTWSGTHTFQEINGTIIPRYLWKVVWYNDEEVVAIVHVNDPSPTEKDIKCKDINCNKYLEWIEFNDKYTYCCLLPDFSEAFNIHNIDIGESLDAALEEMKKKSD